MPWHGRESGTVNFQYHAVITRRPSAPVPGLALPEDVLRIDAWCIVRTSEGHRVVLVGGVPIAQYAVGDRMAEAHAVVSLLEQGGA